MINKSKFEQYFMSKGEFKNLELTLDRISNAASEAGISDNIAKTIIHIAGTNGKGSTTGFIEQILAHRGLTTASFTSPHITEITERIRLNGQNVSIGEFDSAFDLMLPLIKKHNLSYFEALTLLGFYIFKENFPDTAIIETGLGGRFDSTNILNKKIPVITSISKDHVDFLGDDVLGIADEKLGIVKNNLMVFVGDNTEYMNKYLDYKLHSKTIIRGTYSDEQYFGFAKPFSNNLRLAEAVCDFIVTGGMPDSLYLPPCRGEKIGRFILNGAHNEDALNLLKAEFAGKQPVVVYSATKDRDISKMLEIVESFASKVIVTAIPNNERSIDINNLSTSNIKETDPEKALKIAVELNENADILVCGSLYLCANVREILTKGLL